MLTYLIQETRPEVKGTRLAVGGGINNHFVLVLLVMNLSSPYAQGENCMRQ